jgi:ubiquinone/menaquinone biosynthesis C-methylase UbiE
LFEVLCFYSTSFDKLRLSRKCQTVQMTFTLLDEIIRVLKSEGALLNHIRPELLMGYTECTAYFRSIESAEKYYQIPWTDNEEEYNILQKRSWVVLIYQILRIYNSYRSNGGRKTSAGKVEQSTQKLST